MKFDKEISFRTATLGAAAAAFIASKLPAVAPHQEIIGAALGLGILWLYDRVAFWLKSFEVE